MKECESQEVVEGLFAQAVERASDVAAKHIQLEFRGALGQFATGVCVISAYDPAHVPIAMTINSFSSLSLDPRLVLWNIKKQSLCHSLFLSARRYAISVLSESQVDLSIRYSRPGDHVMNFDDYSISATDIPYVRDCLAYFECENVRLIDAGDHQIVVAAVDAFSVESEGRPLVFFGSRYRSLGY